MWREIVILKLKIGVISCEVVNKGNLVDCTTFFFSFFFLHLFCYIEVRVLQSE